jgi:uncharacterized protein YggE
MKNITSILAILLITQVTLAQNGKNFIDQPYIEVNGFSETEIIPDEIYLRIELNENDKNGRRSIEQQENNMLAKLRQLGIDLDKDLSVLNFSGFFRKKFLANNEVKKRKSYQLIVHDGKTMGEVFRTLDDLDVSNFYIMRTSHSKMEVLKQENKIEALLVAKQKASNYAQALEQDLGKAIFVSENQNSYNTNPNVYREYSKSYDAVAAVETIQNLSLKPIKLTSTILARFQLN